MLASYIINERTRLVIVLILAAITILLSIFMVHLLNIHIIPLITGILPAIAASSYLVYSFLKQKKCLADNSIRVQIPFFLFAIILIPIVATVVFSIFYHFEIYYQIFSFGMIMVWMYIFFYLPLAICDRFFKKKSKAPLLSKLLTVIVAAYNEEANLEYSLDSIVKADYPNKQIIIVVNGSTDQTFSVASRFQHKFSNNRNVISVIRKKSKGKATALNYALRFAKGEIVVFIDADSIIETNALTEIVKEFQNPDVNAIAGICKISNRCNTLTKIIALEMVVFATLLRHTYSSVDMVSMVPGALGAYRKKALLERGLYDKDTLVEDYDLTIKILKGGGKIVTSTATCYSKAAATLTEYYHQRTRWMRGNFQTLMKHKNILINGRYGMLHKFVYPAMLLSFLIVPVMDVVMLGLAVYSILKGFIAPLIIPFVVFTLLQVVVGALAIVVGGNEKDWKLIVYSPLFIVGYRHIGDFIILESVFDVLIRKNLKWTHSMHYKGSINTSSQILLTIITTPLKLIDKIVSARLQSAIINNPAKARYTLIVFYLVLVASIGAIFFTEVNFGENGHTYSLSATKFIYANNNVWHFLYDSSYVAVLEKMSHLIPNNVTLLSTHNAPETGYFTGYRLVIDTTANGLNSKKLILDFMIQRNITYLVTNEPSYPPVPPGLIGCNRLCNFKELRMFTTELNFKLRLFERIYDNSFISALKKMSHLVPNDETILVSHDTQRIMHLSGHKNMMSLEPAAMISKEALINFMEKKKVHYFISFEFENPDFKLFNSKGQLGLKTDLKELNSFTTDNFKVHLYKLGS
jgi:cellulose synthase/poly-beta-1,6-N-acetylglucosamine synthase-like glycosyltransferase